MKEDVSDIQRLIRLKRHEQPPENFVDHFMEEFVRRQRAQHLKRSCFSSILEDIYFFLGSWSIPQWTLASATAAIVVGLYFMSTPGGEVTAGSGTAQTVKFSNKEWKVAPQIYLDGTTDEQHDMSDLFIHLLGNHNSGGFTSADQMTPQQVIEQVPDRAPLEIEPILRFND
jgi:hypothetical protein